MLLASVWFVVGLVLLLGGGDLLVRGASRLARILGISPLVIGLTVVAFGTSAPELAVNLIGAWRGQGELAFGNVFGSNLANLGLVLGATVMLRPLGIRGVIIVREIPMMLLGIAAVGIMIADAALRGLASALDRADGFLLLLYFSVFLYYTVREVVQGRSRDPLVKEAEAFRVPGARGAVALNLGLTGAGLAGLVAGGRVTVHAATEIARGVGVSEAVIGLVLVGIGTSLPELATAVLGAWRGHADLVLGNILGSNIFNTLFILGSSAIVRPIAVPVGGGGDVVATALLSAILIPFAMTDDRRMVRWEGVVLVLAYLGYVGARLVAL